MNDQLRYAIQNIQTKKGELLIQTIIIFILPIVALNMGLISLRERMYLIIIVVVLLCIALIAEKWTFQMIGIHMHNFRKFILPYAIFTLVAISAVVLFAEKIGHDELEGWIKHSHFIYGFFVVSLFQEIAYRGYLIPALGKLIRKQWILVIVNALIFTYLHSIFPNLAIGLPLAFIGGLGFAIMYIKYPNLPLIIISHSLINFFVVLYGFFVIPGLTY